MKSIQYELEIYEPNSADDVWAVFDSSTPFMTISKGDILNPGTWPNTQSPMKVLRVINVEHLIWESGVKVTQKLLVFTEEVAGTRELRLARS